jgi:acyl carrier protein
VDPIQSTVKDYILQEFLPDADASELTATTPLIAGGILDSLATVRLVMFLEQNFDIEVQAHETSADNLDTLERIAGFVRAKQAARKGGKQAP